LSQKPDKEMETTTSTQVRRAVRVRYAESAKSGSSCCSPSCCGDSETDQNDSNASVLGYSEDDILFAGESAGLSLGCGNPRAIADLNEGETVLDLGSGAGFDCQLAAREVGPSGFVIGVDMTPEMIDKARMNATKNGIQNVEFRLGEIEHLPVQDHSVDVILSNCVINLSPEKQNVFAEAFRVLKHGGRLAISDIVASANIPDNVKSDLALYTACISGAATVDELESMLKLVGFVDIRIEPRADSTTFIKEWVPGRHIEDFIVSASIQAVKP
jgi:SAM-dependent methyltransferase